MACISPRSSTEQMGLLSSLSAGYPTCRFLQRVYPCAPPLERHTVLATGPLKFKADPNPTGNSNRPIRRFGSALARYSEDLVDVGSLNLPGQAVQEELASMTITEDFPQHQRAPEVSWDMAKYEKTSKGQTYSTSSHLVKVLHSLGSHHHSLTNLKPGETTIPTPTDMSSNDNSTSDSKSFSGANEPNDLTSPAVSGLETNGSPLHPSLRDAVTVANSYFQVRAAVEAADDAALTDDEARAVLDTLGIQLAPGEDASLKLKGFAISLTKRRGSSF
ncbi:predicted protein [Aspergillus nidulans FGSC A4]|uniref:Uncharacterized protein n=1 Tax=Emericella nidulans (strain FGSC A4 / ATCC 38163 / CBS 112.46 / NRRL 194 / M139) TaxID=227321 RepID=Q5BGW0_EMENI|nr:hypothetical protein [Aspergillus nidulans FGSC A4]EAA66093.1 predicted protein [Aspergillus nidulans FGSC A4]CBF89946.1 TPA: hypothetical protein ANIA_00220 [Aspergillus nidulans FGSC A4]|eukprot:XP_657824.1 predicted protein [Aspergillus nidulans FGSC A4]